MKEKSIEYLAGYFDGDGSISIARNYNRLYHNDMPTTILKLNVSSAIREDLVRFIDFFDMDEESINETESNLSENKQ